MEAIRQPVRHVLYRQGTRMDSGRLMVWNPLPARRGIAGASPSSIRAAAAIAVTAGIHSLRVRITVLFFPRPPEDEPSGVGGLRVQTPTGS